jgi:hypothetical protein
MVRRDPFLALAKTLRTPRRDRERRPTSWLQETMAENGE